jgi:hypothetical protein
MNLLLEGDDLEALLVRAHREGGAAARIVRAQKVRRGGILGFFAREGFEVAVEIPAGPGDPEMGPGSGSDFGSGSDLDSGNDLDEVDGFRPGSSSQAPDLLSLIERASAADLVSAVGARGATGAGNGVATVGEVPDRTTAGIAERASAAERAAAVAVVQKAAYQAAIRADAIPTIPSVSTTSAATSAVRSARPARSAAAVPPRARRLDLGGMRGLVGPGTTDLDDPMVAVALAVAQVEQEDADHEDDEPAFAPLHFRPVTVVKAIPLNTEAVTADQAGMSELSLSTLSTASAAGQKVRTPRAAFTALVDQLREVVPNQTTHVITTVGGSPNSTGSPAGQANPSSSTSSWTVDDTVDDASAAQRGRRSKPTQPDDLPPLSTVVARATTVVPRVRPRRGSKHAVVPAVDADGYWSDLRTHNGPDQRVGQISQSAPVTQPGPVGHGGQVGHAGQAEPAETVTSDDVPVSIIGRGAEQPPPRRVPRQNRHGDHGRTDPMQAPGFTGTARSIRNGPTVPVGTELIDSADQLANDRRTLATLGVPAGWLEELRAGDRFASILDLLSRVPELILRKDIALIAVVGAPEVVELEASRTVLDLPAESRPRTVTLAPGQTGIDRRAAMARSKRTRPVVVSVPVDGSENSDAIPRILSNLNAETVIAVVDASRPLNEISAWVGDLGRVDAIALHGALDAGCPAAALALDIPVIRVDGIAVDRIGWAALLCAQLASLDSAR